MQANGQNESIQSLTLLLLQDLDEDKLSIRNSESQQFFNDEN